MVVSLVQRIAVIQCIVTISVGLGLPLFEGIIVLAGPVSFF